MKTTPCAQCPWRRENQGKKHKHGFYTKANLRRLWNQIRDGGAPQSCHLTDPSHPDHVSAGAKPAATAQECPGAVIVVLREVKQMATENNVIEAPRIEQYLRDRKKHGLKKSGIQYWVVQRIAFGGVPLIGSPKLPDVEDDMNVGLPKELEIG